MNRVGIIVAGGLVLAAGIGAALYFSARPEPVAPAATPVAAEPVPAATPTPGAKPPVVRPAAPAPTPSPEPAPTTGTLIVESDVPDTSVFVNRQYAGTAPVTVRDLRPGAYNVSLSATGYDGITDTVEVPAGTRTLSVRFKEIKLDLKLAVVHKHAIGSCSGTLHATPAGLTYTTENKNDAFTVTLPNLETFTFDYLENNMRVKIRGGKTYNFADPEGNADRLYAFHRDVDKTRLRVIDGGKQFP